MARWEKGEVLFHHPDLLTAAVMAPQAKVLPPFLLPGMSGYPDEVLGHKIELAKARYHNSREC